MADILVPLIFLGFFAGFGWLVYHGWRTGRRRRAELAAKAGEAGWRVDRQPSGRVTQTEIRPAEGDWVLRLRPSYSRKSGKSRTTSPGMAELTFADPAWPDGMAVFAQKQGGRAAARMEQVMGGLGSLLENSMTRVMLSRLIGAEMAEFAGRLRPFEPPPGIELMILATEDPRGGDLGAIHRAIHGWRPVRGRDQGPPSVTIGPQGTRLRLNYALYEVADFEAFIATGQTLAAALRTS